MSQNLPVNEINLLVRLRQVLHVGSSDLFFCFSYCCVFFFFQVSVTGTIQEWATTHCFRALFSRCSDVLTRPQRHCLWTEGLLQCDVPKKKGRKKDWRFFCACIHAMYPSQGNLLLNSCRVYMYVINSNREAAIADCFRLCRFYSHKEELF